MNTQVLDINVATENNLRQKTEDPKAKKFQLSAKNLYLTYSHCPLELAEVKKSLSRRLSSYKVVDFIMSRKYDENGDPHIHVYIKTLKKCNIVGENFLDIIGKGGEIYHGNYQTTKNKNMVIEDILESVKSKTDPNLYYSKTMSGFLSESGVFKNLYELLIDFAEKGKVSEGMEYLKKESPELFIKEGTKIEKRLLEILEKKKGIKKND